MKHLETDAFLMVLIIDVSEDFKVTGSCFMAEFIVSRLFKLHNMILSLYKTRDTSTALYFQTFLCLIDCVGVVKVELVIKNHHNLSPLQC